MKALWTGVPSHTPFWHALGAFYLAHKSMLELNIRYTDES